MNRDKVNLAIKNLQFVAKNINQLKESHISESYSTGNPEYNLVFTFDGKEAGYEKLKGHFGDGEGRENFLELNVTSLAGGKGDISKDILSEYKRAFKLTDEEFSEVHTALQADMATVDEYHSRLVSKHEAWKSGDENYSYMDESYDYTPTKYNARNAEVDSNKAFADMLGPVSKAVEEATKPDANKAFADMLAPMADAVEQETTPQAEFNRMLSPSAKSIAMAAFSAKVPKIDKSDCCPPGCSPGVRVCSNHK